MTQTVTISRALPRARAKAEPKSASYTKDGDRISKAWRCRIKGHKYGINEGDIHYGATAGAARYAFMRSLDWDDIEFKDITAHRVEYEDRILPQPHRLVAELSEDERHIISHAYGAGSREPGYRDHYCTHPGDMRLFRLAHELDLFSGPFGKSGYLDEGNYWAGVFYYLTDLGKHVARSMMPTYRGAR